MAAGFHLYLIRHAQSANNAVPDSQRIEDPPLTPVGQKQADLLAARFRADTVTHLLTSGFLRAVQTMRPLAAALNQRPAIWTDLHEVGGCFRGYEPGKLEGRPGMNRERLVDEFPEFELPGDIDESGWWRSRSFETSAQARVRAQQQAARLLDTFQGTESRVACVIHADFKALLLEALLRSDYRKFAHADLENTGVTRLSFSSEQIEVHEFNDASHLPEQLCTS